MVTSIVFGIGVEEVQASYWVDYCRYNWDPPDICSHKIELMLDHKPRSSTKKD